MSIVLMGSTSGSVTLAEPAIAGTTVLDLPATSGTVGLTVGQIGMKNRIINGAMVISQYNGTSSNTPINNGYPIDRFIYKSTQASKFTAQQVTTAPAGFINSLQLTVASAVTIGSSDFFAIGQRIEGLNLYDIGFGTAACKTTSLSFQVRSSLTGTFGGALTNAAGDASYAFTYTISAANTWTSISIAVPAVTTGTWVTDNSTCLQVWFGLGVGSTYNGTAGSWVSGNNFSATGAISVVANAGATFLITGVQLEVGSAATTFDFRSIGTELALCQRYYQRLNSNGNRDFNGYVYSSALIVAQVQLPVPMRTTPSTLTTSGTAGDYTIYYTNTNTNMSAVPALNTAGSNFVCITAVPSASLTAGQGIALGGNNTSAYYALSAEL
jgi:hypothetical protein